MEEQKQENTKVKKEHTRISLLAFFYTLCVISIISLVCLVYVLHLRNKDTEERLTNLEKSVQTIQSTDNDSNV